MANNKTLRDHASGLAESLAPRVESARDKAAPYVSDVRDRATPYLNDARDRVGPALSGARDFAVPYVTDVRDVTAPYVTGARDKAAPYVADARDRVSETFTSEILPVVTAALASFDEATEDARAETLRRGKAMVAALRGEIEARAQEEPVVEPPPSSGESGHWGRTLLVTLGLSGAGFAAFKKLAGGGGSSKDAWQSSYSPPPVPGPEPAGTVASDTPLADAAAAEAATDVAASDPAEAVADSTDVPHVTTTPDGPVTEVDLDEKR